MSTVKVRIHVNELSNVMIKYDRIKIYRSDAEDGVYSEITIIATRLVLDADTVQYEYIDTTAPSALYWYRTSYFHSSTLLESDQADPIQGIDDGLVISLQDIRDEGIEESELSDDRALFLSSGWQSWFENYTGMWFTRKERTFLVDGDGSRVLWLPTPIISIDELYINDDFVNVVDATQYTVYNRYYPQDDRKNPRIKLKRQNADVYSSFGNYVFNVGDQNQKIVGTFGYLEEDGSTPFGVHRAIMQLIVTTTENMSDGDIDVLRDGLRIEEVTDRHRIKFANLWDDIGQWSPTGLTDVDMALKMYRKPAHISMARKF